MHRICCGGHTVCLQIDDLPSGKLQSFPQGLFDADARRGVGPLTAPSTTMGYPVKALNPVPVQA